MQQLPGLEVLELADCALATTADLTWFDRLLALPALTRLVLTGARLAPPRPAPRPQPGRSPLAPTPSARSPPAGRTTGPSRRSRRRRRRGASRRRGAKRIWLATAVKLAARWSSSGAVRQSDGRQRGPWLNLRLNLRRCVGAQRSQAWTRRFHPADRICTPAQLRSGAVWHPAALSPFPAGQVMPPSPTPAPCPPAQWLLTTALTSQSYPSHDAWSLLMSQAAAPAWISDTVAMDTGGTV
ncbi:MAG: hypothetical protein J3K34DRAFT_160926 [Monoraphidium minutum]|nr:MAG: hypothetical protein J3K34DRAFT_160926 [Monoraphidium minutum]